MEELELRIPRDLKVLIEQAARVEDESVEDFVLGPAVERARSVMGPKAVEILEMTAEETYCSLVACHARLAVLSGEPLRLWSDEEGRKSAAPEGGWLLQLWEPGRGFVDWYPDEEAARAALVLLSQDEEGSPNLDGMTLDLTYRRKIPGFLREPNDPAYFSKGSRRASTKLVNVVVEIRPNDGKIPGDPKS